MSEPLDLGSGFSLRFTSWTPERELNPQYEGIPDTDRMGAIVTCAHGVEGAILFDLGPEYERLFPGRPRWKVEQWEPLTLSPSLDAGCCHGHITEGRWVPA